MDAIQILLNIFYALFGAVMGVIFGTFFSIFQHNRDRFRRKWLLMNELVSAFKFNIARIEQMQEQLSKNIMPDYKLDSESVSHILFHGRDLFENHNTMFDQFNWQRYQLAHINAKLDFINGIMNLNGTSLDSRSVPGGVAQQRHASLVAHLQITHKEISALIQTYRETSSRVSESYLLEEFRRFRNWCESFSYGPF